MQATKIDPQELAAIVDTIGHDLYADNLTTRSLADASSSRTTRTAFTLRVHDSSGAGARRAPSGRRGIGACWHAHRDVMREVFARYPDAKISSALATYDGADDFADTFPGTYYEQVGSIMEPATFGELCDCDA